MYLFSYLVPGASLQPIATRCADVYSMHVDLQTTAGHYYYVFVIAETTSESDNPNNHYALTVEEVPPPAPPAPLDSPSRWANDHEEAREGALGSLPMCTRSFAVRSAAPVAYNCGWPEGASGMRKWRAQLQPPLPACGPASRLDKQQKGRAC